MQSPNTWSDMFWQFSFLKRLISLIILFWRRTRSSRFISSIYRYFLFLDFEIQKDHYHSTVSRTKSYEISFDFKPAKFTTGKVTNIIQLTASTRNVSSLEGCLPCVWLQNKKLKIINSVFNKVNIVQTTRPLVLNVYSSVSIRFGQGPDNHYIYTILMDGEIVHEERSTKRAAQKWDGVKVYTGSPYYNPAKAFIRNVQMKRIKGIVWLKPYPLL